LSTGTSDTELDRTVTLLLTAIRGAAMPVLVHRGTGLRPARPPALEALAPPLFIPAPFKPAGGRRR